MEIPTDKAELEAFRLDLVRRAATREPEACFEIGVYNLSRATAAHYDAADRAFAKAVEYGGSSWAWRAVDEYTYTDIAHRFGRWMARGIELEFPLPSAPGITVASDAFEPVGDDEVPDGGITWSGACLQVRTDQAQPAEAALLASISRLSLVDETGRESPTAEALWEAIDQAPHDRYGNPLYSPSWVSNPHPHPAGPWIMLDTNSAMWGPMARTILRIIIEELVAAGVTKAEIVSAYALAMGKEI